jgi:hypothetical protein
MVTVKITYSEMLHRIAWQKLAAFSKNIIPPTSGNIKQHIPPKPWYTPTRLHGAITQAPQYEPQGDRQNLTPIKIKSKM